jgi:hypothetical protein
MRASDLSDEDIGREFLVQLPTGGSERRRVTFEGFTRRPDEMERADGSAYWLILKCSPSSRSVLRFRTLTGEEFSGLLVRSNAQVWALDVEWAVTEDGIIVEIGVKAA